MKILDGPAKGDTKKFDLKCLALEQKKKRPAEELNFIAEGWGGTPAISLENSLRVTAS